MIPNCIVGITTTTLVATQLLWGIPTIRITSRTAASCSMGVNSITWTEKPFVEMESPLPHIVAFLHLLPQKVGIYRNDLLFQSLRRKVFRTYFPYTVQPVIICFCNTIIGAPAGDAHASQADGCF